MPSSSWATSLTKILPNVPLYDRQTSLTQSQIIHSPLHLLHIRQQPVLIAVGVRRRAEAHSPPTDRAPSVGRRPRGGEPGILAPAASRARRGWRIEPGI